MACLALVPLGYDELSINYLFVLVPLAWVLSRGRVESMPDLLRLATVIFGLVFVFSILIAPDHLTLLPRRLASFAIFMTFLAFAIVKVQPDDVSAFKLAVVTMSVVYSLQSIVVFLAASAAGPVDFEAKNLVGSQRYGFVYVLGLWILLLGQWSGRGVQVARAFGLVIITGGLGLTFSRSAVVATLGSAALFGAVRVLCRLVRFEIRVPNTTALIGLLLAVVAVGMTLRFFPLTSEFYWQTLFAPIADGSLFEAMRHSGSSEGIRVVRVMESLNYLAQYPLTGSGYLGIWTVSPTGGGSAHNQLLDVLLRVGAVGFVTYVAMLVGLMRFLSRTDNSLFWGLISILIYGFFHETFKESQGAFILAFLVGMMAQDWRDRHLASARSARAFTAPVTAP